MKARGYTGENEMPYPSNHLYSKRELLFGHHGLFRPQLVLPPQGEDSPKKALPKVNYSRKRSLHVLYHAELYPAKGVVNPTGWEEISDVLIRLFWTLRNVSVIKDC